MQISVESNIDKLARELPAFYRKQIPFATSQALNDTARLSATEDVRADMKKELEQTNRFTLAGSRYNRSTKANLTAQVYIGPLRWKYLRFAVNAGTRRPENKVLVIPTREGAKLRKRNPRGWIKKALMNKAIYWGQKGDTYGLWKTNRRGDNTLLAFTTPRAQYTESFDYRRSVQRSIDTHFTRAFDKRMRRAIDTARI
jgi:hypothetical protein